MTGKGQARHVPTLGARGVDVEDAERNRQTLAAVDDPYQVGVLQIVIGQLVAGIAILQQDDLVERAGPRREVARRALMTPDVARQQPEMIAVARQVDMRAL